MVESLAAVCAGGRLPVPLLSTSELAALASGLLWAIGVILFARAGQHIAPLPLNLFKNAISLVFLLPLMLLVDGGVAAGWDLATWSAVAISGVLGITIADTFFFAALNRLGAGLNAIVDCMYFPAMVAVAAVALDEAVGLGDVFGGGLVIAGVLLSSPIGRSHGSHQARGVVVGIVLGTLGMVLVAVSVALLDDVLAREPALSVTACRLAVASMALLPLNLTSAGAPATLRRLARPGPLWRHAVPAAVVGGALAMWAWLAGFGGGDVSRVAVLNQLSTIWIAVLAVVFLREPTTRRRLLALGLAFGGVLMVMTG